MTETETESFLHRRRKAININANLIFGEDVESDHPFEQEVEWLRQYCTAGLCGYYIVEGHETYPIRIWHGQKNDVNAYFQCIYENLE